jgi:hypothetical protein
VEIKNSYLAMIKAYPGGWGAMSGALGMTQSALENRIYERKGQAVLVETAMQMQAFSGTTLFAESIARASGGVFVKIPEVGEVDNDALLLKFNELHAHLGMLSRRFGEYTKDGELTEREQRDLRDISDEIHMTMQELLQLTVRVYGRAPRNGAAE